MPKAEKPKLTVKQMRFVKAVAEGKNKREAAMLAYDTTDPDTASTIAKENLQRASVIEALHAELSRQGITLEKIIKPVANALNHEEVEMQLKGHDRAMRIIAPRNESPTFNNFGVVISEQRNKYDI